MAVSTILQFPGWEMPAADILPAVAADAFPDISSNLFNLIENVWLRIDFIPDSWDWVDLLLVGGYQAKITLWARVL